MYLQTQLKKLCTIALILLCSTLSAQVSGIVFRDINGNGLRSLSNPNEPLESDIIVNAYDASGSLIASYTTSGLTTPNYSIPASGTAYNGTPGSNTGFIAPGTQVRLEFVIPSAKVNTASSFIGGANATSVQFLTSPVIGTANYAVFNPGEFWQNNPRVVIPRYYRGTNPLSTTNTALVSFPYTYGEEKDGSTTAAAGTYKYQSSSSGLRTCSNFRSYTGSNRHYIWRGLEKKYKNFIFRSIFA